MHIRHTIWALFQNKVMRTNLCAFSRQLHERRGRSRLWYVYDMVRSSLFIGSLFTEYMQFKFYDRDWSMRKTFFTTFQEYFLLEKWNRASERDVFWDKKQFLERFSEYVKRSWSDIQDVECLEEMLRKSKELVLKGRTGDCGKQVAVVDWKGTAQELVMYMKEHDYQLAEELLHNHDSLNELNESSLNTIRYMTITNGERVIDLYAALRVGAKGVRMDNISQGGSYAVVDISSGKLVTPFYGKVTNGLEVFDESHIGMQLPMWEQVKEVAHNAALVMKNTAMVAWDIAITPEGPAIVEGNHSFGCDILQIHCKKDEEGLYPCIVRAAKELGLEINE